MNSTDEKVEVETYSHVTDATGENNQLSELDNGEIAKEAIGGTTKNLPRHYYRSFNFMGTMLAVYFGYMAGIFSFICPTNILSTINEDIGPDPNYAWFAIVWNLTSALGFVFVGRLTDLCGRRWFFIIGNSIALLGCIIAGTAHSIPVLILGGAFLGLGASVQLTYATVISELIPNKNRAAAIGTLCFATIPAQAFGTIIAREFVLNTKQGWRWPFYLGLIMNALSVALYYLCYHPPTYTMLHARRQTKVSVWKMLDVVGALLFTIGLLLLLLGLSWGGQIYPWKTGKVIGTLVSGFVTLVMFVFWEIYGAGDYPLVPMRFFKNPGFVGVLLTAGIANASWAAVIIIWPIQLAVIWPNSYAAVGWKSCIVQSGTIIGLTLGGFLMKPLGKQKLQMIAVTTILTAFIGGMVGVNASTPTMALVFILITCIMVGYVEVGAFTIGPFCLKPEDLGIANGLIGTSRSTLSSLTQAVFVTILENKLATNIPKYVIPDAVDAGLPKSSVGALLEGLAVGNFTAVPGIDQEILTATLRGNQEAYIQSFKMVYYAGIAFAACGIVGAMLVPNCEARFTSTISRKLHGKTGSVTNAAAVDSSSTV